MSRPKIIAYTQNEPLTVAECKLHARIDHADEDALVAAWLQAAREHCENFLGLSLREATLEIALDAFPDGAIELPFGPITAVTSLTVGATVINSADYLLDDYSAVARLLPVAYWPVTSGATNSIKVRYEAGYVAAGMPRTIRAAILLIVGHLAENRQEANERVMTMLPFGVETLLRPYRVRMGMA